MRLLPPLQETLAVSSGCNRVSERLQCRVRRPLLYLNSCDLTITATARSIVPMGIVLKDNARRPKLLVIMAGDATGVNAFNDDRCYKSNDDPCTIGVTTSEPNITPIFNCRRK